MSRAQAMANKRRRNNGADQIAHVIHQMVDTMQPIVTHPRAMVAPACPMIMEDFMRHMPSKFTGKSTPDKANTWLRECEKICRVIDCI